MMCKQRKGNVEMKEERLSFEEMLQVVSERVPTLRVTELLMTEQDSYIIEVYNEEANVVLRDDGDCDWAKEKLVLRSHRVHVIKEYGLKRVYKWTKVGDVLKLCLGHIHAPAPETLQEAEKWLARKKPL